MTPLNNGLLVCGQIGIVLIGAFPMVEWITRTFGGALSKLGGALGMNDKGLRRSGGYPGQLTSPCSTSWAR